MYVIHNKRNKLYIIIAAFIIIVISAAINTTKSYSATMDTTHYRLSTSVVFVWKNSEGKWLNEFSPGDTITFSEYHSIGQDMKEIRAYRYNPEAKIGTDGYFDFNNSQYFHWNKGAATNYASYNLLYYDYSANHVKISGEDKYDADTGKLQLVLSATLKTVSGINYDVKEKLSFGVQGKSELLELLGSPPQDLIDAMNLMDPASEQYNPNVEGYLYFVPVIIQYTVTTEVPDDPIELPEEEPVLPEEEPPLPKLMQGQTVLDLPQKTYEGHTVEAMDMSQFMVDGEAYSARRLYEEDLASNSFSIPKYVSGSVHRTGLTTSDVTIDKTGFYPVTLRVDAETGGEFTTSSKLTDTKSIEVMETPAILENLAGVQKKNRKQILNITVATSPKYPLTELWVELERCDGAEKVKLEHVYTGQGFDETKNTVINSELIKTRAIDQTEADQYFTTVQLAFLTKNDFQEEFTYRIYAKDCRGQDDIVEADFVVKPDLPPEAKIGTEDSFLRTKGTDIAVVTAEDSSICDGDQVNRSWFAAPMNGNGLPYESSGEWVPMNMLSGYRDLSFGTGKKVSFDKIGVGPVQFRLKVRDVWVEDTLPEYIAEEDYLKDEAEAFTEVVNIAPVVSLKPVFSREEKVLLLAEDNSVFSDLKAGCNILREKLIEKGIDGDIIIERVPGQTTSDAIRGYYPGASAELPYGFNGLNTFLEDKWFSIDEENLYTINGTWLSGTHDYYPEMPYVISSINADDNTCNWTYTINQDVMDIKPGDAESFAHDDSGKYLFFRYGGQTLIIAKDTGAYLAVVDMILGDFNFVGGPGIGSDSSIYTVKPDGIYAISVETGGIRKIYDGRISGTARRVAGQINFLVKTGPMAISRGKMDPLSEQIILSSIPKIEKDAADTPYNCIGMDAEGTMIIGLNDDHSVRVYGADNKLIKEINGWKTDRDFSVTPVYDEKGKCNYIASSWEVRGSTKYYSYAGVWSIYDDSSYNCSMYSTNGFRTDADHPMFAMQAGDKIFIQTGAMWAGLYGGGSVMGYYNEYAYICTFDLTDGSGSFNAAGDYAFGMAGEYGRYTDPMVAASYTFNGDSADVGPDTGMNGLRAKIMLRYNSLSEIINRFLSKHAANTDFNEGKSEGASFYYIGRNDLDGVVYDRLAESIADEDRVYETVMAVQQTGGAEKSSISREYLLDPDKTYYYEYAAKGLMGEGQPLIWNFVSESGASEEHLGETSYHVTHAELEDFNDSETNPYFNIAGNVVANGVCKGADLNNGDTKLPNRIFTDESTMTFEVPPGKKAVLSFDYDIKSKGWTSSEIFVNEKRWNRLVGVSGGKGHYTSPQFLPEGLNSVRFATMDYGTLPLASYVYIDNLKVFYVDKSPGSQFDKVGGNEDWSAVDHENGWRHYSGQFRTPPEVMNFKICPGEYIQSDFQTSSSDLITKNAEKPDNKTLTIELPEGKAALDAGMTIESSPTATSSNSYNVTWKWPARAYTWTCYGRAEAGTLPLQTPKFLRVSLGTLNGSNHFTESARSTYGSWGDFRKVEFYLADNEPQPVLEGRFFYENDSFGQPAAMYIENEKYTNKTRLSFSNSTEELWYIKGLKLYCIENGIKVYVEENSPGYENEATKWETSNCAAMAVKLKSLPEKPEDNLIYKKGQLVAYDIFYSDYEKDPSRREYWRYTHTPMNDGFHPMAAAVTDAEGVILDIRDNILDKPIDRFYVDGKYTAEHWQEDNTARLNVPVDSDRHPLGYPDYNKPSNLETITFYVVGTATAPWVKEIKTMTLSKNIWSDSAVDYRDTFKLKIHIDDKEKDTLSLTTEVYIDRRRIFTHIQKGINADNTGKYPAVLTGPLPDPAETGAYQAICTVRDETGAGIGTHRFIVENIVPSIRIHRLF